jgi:hypothetical protein
MISVAKVSQSFLFFIGKVSFRSAKDGTVEAVRDLSYMLKEVAQHDFVSANLNRVRALEGNEAQRKDDTINDNCSISCSWGTDTTIMFHHFNLGNSRCLGQGFISSMEK